MPAKKAKSSKWITHVKAYAKANNCSYGDAMSRAKSSYRSQSGGAWYNDAHTWVKNNKAISKGATMLADSGLAGRHAGTVRKIGSLVDRFGYGK